MTRVALRGIRAHLGRVLMSVVAVLLGVAFVSGTFSLRSMMSSTFDDIVASSTQADAYLQGATSVAGTGQSQGGPTIGRDRNQIPLSLVDTVSGVSGVDAVIPDIGGSIILVGADGTAVMGAGGAPSFGTSFDPKDPTAHVVAGHAPQGPDQIALVPSSIAASGLSVGDATKVVLGGEPARRDGGRRGRLRCPDGRGDDRAARPDDGGRRLRTRRDGVADRGLRQARGERAAAGRQPDGSARLRH